MKVVEGEVGIYVENTITPGKHLGGRPLQGLLNPKCGSSGPLIIWKSVKWTG
jgi:hypothetical protein